MRNMGYSAFFFEPVPVWGGTYSVCCRRGRSLQITQEELLDEFDFQISMTV